MRPSGCRRVALSCRWTAIFVAIAVCAIAPASVLAASMSTSGGGGPVIAQTARENCLATPSATIHLRGPVVAGDDLVLLVSGQGFDGAAPIVTSVTDPVNGHWTALVNYKSATLDNMRHLSYAAYQVTNAKAAPSGLIVTVNQQPGQSAAGAVLLDVTGPVGEAQPRFQSALQESAQNTLTSPSVKGASGDLAVGLFGAYNMGQTFSADSPWTLLRSAWGCTRALAESQAVSTPGSKAANMGVSSWTDYYGGLVVFSDPSASSALTLPPLDTSPPTISGTPDEGSTLTASPGSWADTPTSYAYQWQDCDGLLCSNISGATSSSYTLASSDVGKTVDVVVTATNGGGSTPATSAKTGTVQAPSTPTRRTPRRRRSAAPRSRGTR